MNNVTLTGRLTRKPELKTTSTGKSVCKFSLAVDRMGEGADFPSVTCFGKTAENVARFLDKGSKCGVLGRIQTGSYEKDGVKIYTTDVVAINVEFLDSKNTDVTDDNVIDIDITRTNSVDSMFEEIDDDDIPF